MQWSCSFPHQADQLEITTILGRTQCAVTETETLKQGGGGDRGEESST